MNETMENAALIKAAKDSMDAKKRLVEVDGVALTVGNHGQLCMIDDLQRVIDSRAPMPRRKVGESTHSDIASFVKHVNIHKSKNSTIWANPAAGRILAVYNGHTPGDPGWGDHRAKYICGTSSAWKKWYSQDGTTMTQTQFSEWIDENMEDLIEREDYPMPIEILEMSRNLQIFTKGEFTKTLDRATGTYSLVCKEEHTSESTKIPRAFSIAIPVFEGGDKYAVEIRIQFRLKEGKGFFTYSMHRKEELYRKAFDEMADLVESQTGLVTFCGMSDG